MGRFPGPNVVAGEGFRKARSLDCRWRTAHGHVRSPNGALTISHADGSDPHGILPSRDWRRGDRLEPRYSRMTRDGRLLAMYTGRLTVTDLATGGTHVLREADPTFNDCFHLSISPDGGTILCLEFHNPHRRWCTGLPQRLWRVSTDGGDYRLLWMSHESACFAVKPCWTAGFALLQTVGRTASAEAASFRIDLESGEAIRLPVALAAADHLSLSPDGTLCTASCWREPGIQIVPLDGRPKQLLTAEGSLPAWSPDGRTVAFMRGQHMASLIEVDTGAVRDVARCDPPVWSPDGRFLWFSLARAERVPVRGVRDWLRETACYVRPWIRNLNPWRSANWCDYQPYCHWRTSCVADLQARTVVDLRAYHYGVEWVEPASAASSVSAVPVSVA